MGQEDDADLAAAPDEELLTEYHDTVHHLGICAAEGQVDPAERRRAEAYHEEILSRMADD